MKLPLSAIPHGEGKHAVKARQGFLDAPLLDCSQHDFCVRKTTKAVAGGFQLVAQIGEVIDFAVEDDYVPATFGVHRLMAVPGKINNRKPPMTEGNTAGPINPDAGIVRAAMGQLVGHATDRNLEFEFSLRRGGQKAGNTAHG